MRIALVILLLAHGLIHILGFVKAYELAEVKQLTHTISKPMGAAWLIAAVLFAVAALLLATHNSYWWVAGAAAVAISQLLIVSTWSDSKFGTIANLLILVAVVVGYGTTSFYRHYCNDVAVGLQQEAYFENNTLTGADISHLPDPVKNYLRFTGSIGKPKVNNFKVTFSGKIRQNEQSEWMPFTSEQYNFMKTPTRLFFMKAVMKGLPVAGYHCFKNGDAYMDIRLFSLFSVQQLDGPEMDLAETVTFFNDMCCMAPPTLIDKRIKWLAVDGNKVKASFTNNGITAVAWLYFNSKGELVNFISNDRYAADAGKKLPWATPLNDYHAVNGYTLVGNAKAVYSYPDRDLCYGTFKLVSVDYNCKEIDCNSNP